MASALQEGVTMNCNCETKYSPEELKTAVLDAAVESLAQQLRAEGADPESDEVYARVRASIRSQFSAFNEDEVENAAISVLVLMSLEDMREEGLVEKCGDGIGLSSNFREVCQECCDGQ
jgi:hypothetical protein